MCSSSFAGNLNDPEQLHVCWQPAVHLIRVLFPDDELPIKDGISSPPDNEFAKPPLPQLIGGSKNPDVDPPTRKVRGMTLTLSRKLHDVCSIRRKVQKDRDAASSYYESYGLPRNLASFADTITGWMQHCKNSDGHEACHRPRTKRLPRLMRLIDVDGLYIVNAPPDAKYAALSYVWGTANQVKLLAENAERLQRKQSLYEFRLPRTIVDAMWICKRLGFQYLWVDALCIMQDNPQDTLFQVNSMRDVYSSATVTIVAACGLSADTSLIMEGAGGTSQSRQKAFDNIVETTGVSEGFQNAIVQTVWESRGWTFQEKCLSGRVLAFTPGGTFYHCRACVYGESGYERLQSLHELPASSIIRRPGWLFNVPPGVQLETYLASVQSYSGRHLSFDLDMENAMKGITRAFGYAMDNKPNSFFHGLPTSAIDQLFCWRTACHDPNKRREEFPSWSWYGWRQMPLFPRSLMDEIARKKAYMGSLIMGYDRHRDPSGKEWGGTELDSHGINNSGPSLPLMLHAEGGFLKVSRLSNEDVGDTNGKFQVSLSGSGVVIGDIQLDKTWRVGEPDQMPFIPVMTKTEEDGVRIKALMCLKKTEKGSWAVNKYERVQVLDCNIQGDDWMRSRVCPWGDAMTVFIG